MKNNRRGRPLGAKNGSRSRKNRTVSFRLSDESLTRLDEIRENLSDLCDIEISRSFMIELLIADERDVRRYKKLIKKILD